ncbi:histamine N-methyltransferase-like [Dendronephthya gigantea]|uniref:histamine N-methyltransferase-like n=1 Tax=Dendronephthya gigantea TaxID=151771 RepID=UPI00106D65F9|nr:histamine N-methyltransferase-like [Dendronephthya gigantea]
MSDLNHDPAYPSYVEEYFDKSTEREVFTEWVFANASKIVVSDFSSGKYAILDVGTPDGDTDLQILSLIWRNLEPGTETSFRIVNAQAAVLEKYKAALSSSKKREYKKIAFDWRAASLPDYLGGKSGESGGCKMNLVFFMQSLYYEEPEQVLVDVYDKELEHNGVIVCVVQDEGNFAVRMQNELRGKDFPKSKRNVSGKDIVAVAEKHEWKCEVDTLEYIVDVGECLKQGSSKGDMLLDMMFNVKDLRKQAPADVSEHITKSLEKEAASSGGSRILREKVAIVMIYK